MLDFWVSFSTKNATFFPNAQVTATVYLKTDRILKARKIDARIIGVAKTGWDEYNYYGQHYEDIIRYGAEIYYINLYTILWESRDGTNKLKPGKYKFPFKFVIPSNAPPCMSGPYGSVAYYVRTNIDIPWAPDEERFCGFSVCPLVDLNLDRRLLQTVYSTGTQLERRCCSCSSNPLNVKVTLPKNGYIPGETIKLKIEISNKTSWKITKIEFGIVENLTFTGHSQSFFGGGDTMMKYSEHIVTFKEEFVISDVNSFTLIVPAIVPTYFECPIITINYSFFVKTYTDAVFSSGPKIFLPITIGSIPIRDLSSSVPPSIPSPAPTATTKKKSGKVLKTEKSVSSKQSTAEKEDDNSEVAVSPKAADE